MNTDNIVILSGKVAADPMFFDHNDGSASVLLKLAVRDNFKSKNAIKQPDGTFTDGNATQFITLQGYLSAKVKESQYPRGVYGMLEVGMPISVNGHMVSYVVKDGATDKTSGKKVNRWEQAVRIDGVQLKETKSEAQLRRANKAAREKAQAPAAAPAAAAPAYAGVATDEFGAVPEGLDA